MSYTGLVVLDPEIPSILLEVKGNSGTDGANNMVIELLISLVLVRSLCKFWSGYIVIKNLLIPGITL